MKLQKSLVLSMDVRAGRWRHTQHKTNEYVWQQVSIIASSQELVNRRKLSWFGHVCRRDTVAKIVLQRTVDGMHCKGRPRKSCMDSIRERTGQSMSRLLCIANDGASIGLSQRRLGVTDINWLTFSIHLVTALVSWLHSSTSAFYSFSWQTHNNNGSWVIHGRP